MWRPTELKISEAKAAEPKMPEFKVNDQKSAVAPSRPGAGPGLAMEQATLGATMTVKGEVSGSQPLYVDGRIEGSVRFPEHRVTIGRTGVVLANIEAKEVVILGSVTGNIECGDRVEIRSDAVLTGDIVTRRISVDEGAVVKGRVEVFTGKARERVENEAAKVAAPVTKMDVAKMETPNLPAAVPASAAVSAAVAAPVEMPKPAAAAAAAGAKTISRVAGSSVLFQESADGK